MGKDNFPFNLHQIVSKSNQKTTIQIKGFVTTVMDQTKSRGHNLIFGSVNSVYHGIHNH